MYAVHHFFTIFLFKSMWMLDHYTWFVIGPAAYHCVIVCFPTFWANTYIYAVLFVCKIFLQLSNKAIMRTNVHIGLLCVTPLLFYPLLNLDSLNCNSSWSLPNMIDDHYEMLREELRIYDVMKAAEGINFKTSMSFQSI